MKRIFFLAMMVAISTSFANAQKMRINGYSAYLFDDKVDSYYDQNNYYNGTIKGGYQWGVGLEYMASRTKGIELKYLRQDTHAPMNYYKNGIKYNDFQIAMNYILLGGSNYFETSGGKIEPYFGLGLGMAIIDIKNPIPSGTSSASKFAWDIKLGTNIWFSDKVGLKLQAELLSAVQSAGGAFYFGTGGAGAGVATYSSMYQFGLGGGLTFKIGN